MTTRTNFYKNPSISYKKDLSLSSALQNLNAYNIVTGAAPPVDEPPPPTKRRRQRVCRSILSGDENGGISSYDDGPMSHHDYINKIRKEKEVQGFQTLCADALETSASATNLVEYESVNTSEGEEDQGPIDSGQTNEVDEVKSRSEQRFPRPGEPVCVVCGKYGEYICNETDDDICSMECKAVLLGTQKLHEGLINKRNSVASSSAHVHSLEMLDLENDTWNNDRHCWSKKRSVLCTYKCWKCQRPGHLAEDCLATINGSKWNSVSRDLSALYRRCNQIGQNSSSARCNVCSTTSRLASCLDCNMVFCDSAGHLNEHIRAHPSHHQIYSYKLKRLVKCCKATCKVTNIRDLLVCHYCFNKAFDKFYDVYAATWKDTGHSIIWGSICCDEHFTWHRMNCLNSDVEDNAYIFREDSRKGTHRELSDFIF